MTLSRDRVLQTIRSGKRELDIDGMVFQIRYIKEISEIGKRAEIVIWSNLHAEILLYPTATLFSVRHELCHGKMFTMGLPLTNTEKDTRLLPNPEDHIRMVLIVEWYTNELQRRVFHEYYSIDEEGTPRLPPFKGLPKLPKDRFTREQIRLIMEIAREEVKTAAPKVAPDNRAAHRARN